MQSLQVVRCMKVACMWVQWVNANRLNYPRGWEGTIVVQVKKANPYEAILGVRVWTTNQLAKSDDFN